MGGAGGVGVAAGAEVAVAAVQAAAAEKAVQEALNEASNKLTSEDRDPSNINLRINQAVQDATTKELAKLQTPLARDLFVKAMTNDERNKWHSGSEDAALRKQVELMNTQEKTATLTAETAASQHLALTQSIKFDKDAAKISESDKKIADELFSKDLAAYSKVFNENGAEAAGVFLKTLLGDTSRKDGAYAEKAKTLNDLDGVRQAALKSPNPPQALQAFGQLLQQLIGAFVPPQGQSRGRALSRFNAAHRARQEQALRNLEERREELNFFRQVRANGVSGRSLEPRAIGSG